MSTTSESHEGRGRASKFRSLALVALGAAALLVPSGALAQGTQGGNDGEAGHLSAQIGFGFTADPGTFLIALEAPYAVGRHLSIGPRIEIGVDDETTLVSPTLHFRYGIDLSDFTSTGNDFVQRSRVFGTGGLGLTHLDSDRGNRDRDDTEFLLSLGFGAEYRLTPDLFLTSVMHFQFIPGEVFDESFYYSWQIAGARFRF